MLSTMVVTTRYCISFTMIVTMVFVGTLSSDSETDRMAFYGKHTEKRPVLKDVLGVLSLLRVADVCKADVTDSDSNTTLADIVHYIANIISDSGNLPLHRPRDIPDLTSWRTKLIEIGDSTLTNTSEDNPVVIDIHGPTLLPTVYLPKDNFGEQATMSQQPSPVTNSSKQFDDRARLVEEFISDDEDVSSNESSQHGHNNSEYFVHIKEQESDPDKYNSTLPILEVFVNTSDNFTQNLNRNNNVTYLLETNKKFAEASTHLSPQNVPEIDSSTVATYIYKDNKILWPPELSVTNSTAHKLQDDFNEIRPYRQLSENVTGFTTQVNDNKLFNSRLSHVNITDFPSYITSGDVDKVRPSHSWPGNRVSYSYNKSYTTIQLSRIFRDGNTGSLVRYRSEHTQQGMPKLFSSGVVTNSTRRFVMDDFNKTDTTPTTKKFTRVSFPPKNLTPLFLPHRIMKWMNLPVVNIPWYSRNGSLLDNNAKQRNISQSSLKSSVFRVLPTLTAIAEEPLRATKQSYFAQMNVTSGAFPRFFMPKRRIRSRKGKPTMRTLFSSLINERNSRTDNLKSTERTRRTESMHARSHGGKLNNFSSSDDQHDTAHGFPHDQDRTQTQVTIKPHRWRARRPYVAKSSQNILNRFQSDETPLSRGDITPRNNHVQKTEAHTWGRSAFFRRRS